MLEIERCWQEDKLFPLLLSHTSNRQVRYSRSENLQSRLLIWFGSMPLSLCLFLSLCLHVNLFPPTKTKEAKDMRLPPHRYRQSVIGMNEPLLHRNCQLVSRELGCMTDIPLIGRFNIERDGGEVDGRLPRLSSARAGNGGRGVSPFVEDMKR